MSAPCPILFLDVDGPLNPWQAPIGRAPAGYTTLPMRPTGWAEPHPPLPVRLDPRHGPLLLGLGYRLVWASTWGAEANTWIAPVLGLPALPYVDWPRPPHRARDGVHWKTRRLVAVADDHPFAWVDDEIADPDRAWIAHHHRGESLLRRVDPATGLLDEDFAALRAWARGE